ncbi:MAG: hypothetical protein IH984_11350 [Planctomycetes bacterium]|nr:hypothetical protein [Planctomycetota bacterium]
MRTELGRSVAIVAATGLAIGALVFPTQAKPQDAGDQEQIEAVEQDRNIRRERLFAEFDAAHQTAKERLQQGDFDGAQRAILTAQIQVGQSRSLLSEAKFAELHNKAEKLIADIATAKANAEEAERIAQEIETTERIKQVQQAALEAREAMIHENLNRVYLLQRELKYREALQVLDEILFIDELNPAAKALKDVITATMNYRDWDAIQIQKNRSYNVLQYEAQLRMVAPVKNFTEPGPRSISGIVAYPEDWPEQSIKRTNPGGYSVSAIDQGVRRMLASTRLRLDFSNNTFGQAITYLTQVTGQEIYVDWKALEFINVDRDSEVTIQLNDISLESALNRILEQVADNVSDRPQWAIQDGVLMVSSDEALRRKTVTLVYDIRDLLFEVPYFDNAPDLDLNHALSQNSRGGGSGGGLGGGFNGGGNGGGNSGVGAIFSDPESDPDRESREDLIERIVSLIQTAVDPDGWRDLGGDTGSIQELNGNLIITNTPQQHQEINGLLSQLREIRALQINVEARVLNVNTDWFEQIGVDLDLYFNTNNTLRQRQLAIDPQGQLSDLFDNNGLLKDPVVFGNFGDVDADGVFTFPFNTIATGALFQLPDGTFVNPPFGVPLRATSGFTPISLAPRTNSLVDSLAEFDPVSFAGIALGNPALSLGLQFLDDVQVDLLIEATQADRRSVILTAPRITFFNGQRSWVAVTTQTAFVSALTPITGDSAAAFQPTITTLSDGFVLDVEGVISADRRYVCMTIIFDFAEFQGFRESSAAEFGGAAGGGGIGGGASTNFTGQVELPIIQGSRIRTTVCVPDRGTVLLGGLHETEEIEIEAGVPILSKIPFINRFFTNRLTSKSDKSLMILIRPEIIIQQENEDMLFPGLSDTLGGAASYFN